ncbi:MAG: hypothetical protein AAFQ43_01275 [Bacteroidota bacterium]
MPPSPVSLQIASGVKKRRGWACAGALTPLPRSFLGYNSETPA